MKRILMASCAMLLVLAACGSSAEDQAANTASISNEQASLRSAVNGKPIAHDSAEGREQAALSPIESSGHDSSSYIESSGQTGEGAVENATDRLIQFTTEEGVGIVFQLNGSPAANNFYRQLPLSIQIEDYAGNEKIFYPPDELDTRDTPPAQGPAGTLAYYAPWGNVAVFYSECGGNSGLYELGEVVSGDGFIPSLAGAVQIEAVGASSASAGFAQAESEPPPSSLDNPNPQDPADGSHLEEDTSMKINLQIGNSTFTATLEKNAAADSLIGLMKTAPLAIQMSDYSGFEKVGSLGASLPASDSQTTAQAGDIVLYNGNQIVIFYGSNSWSYTRLGKIDDLAGWEEALGNGDVTVTFSVG